MRVKKPALLMSLVAAVLLVFLSIGGTASASFSDVPSTHEFYGPISSLAERGIISGYSTGEFGLYDPVMRAQLAKMTVVAYDHHDETVTNQTFPTFKDVVYSGQVYPYDYVEEAAKHGLIYGYSSGNFGPYDPLTRIQLVRIIVRAAGPDLDDPPADYRLSFTDVPAADVPAIAKAKYNGLIDGKSATSFAPYAGATRGHVAKILYNALQKRVNLEPRTREDVSLSAADTAAALADPDRAQAGVWSLLANLRMGVYTAQGAQIMPGSEISSADFYLFSFQLPLLERAATELGPTTTELRERFVALGVVVSEADFLASLRRAYLEENDGQFLAELFRAMDVEFVPGEQLTSLQALLIYIDTLVPPNGEGSTVAQTLSAAEFRTGEACEDLRGDGADAGWGVFWKSASILSDVLDKARDAAKAGTGGMSALVDPVDALHALMMSLGTELEVTTTRTQIHETHPNETPQKAVYTAFARFNTDLIPEDIIRCAALAGFSVPPPGPVEGMGVEWRLDEPILEHSTWELPTGGVVGSTALTNADGKSIMELTPNVEPAEGIGALYEEIGTVTVTMRVQQGDVLNAFAGIQELLFPRRFKGELKVAWHESTWHLRLSTRVASDIEDLNFLWNVYFHVQEDDSLAGWADGSVSGWMQGFGGTYGAFRYVIDPAFARKQMDLGQGGEFSFEMDAFVPTEWAVSLDNGDALSEEAYGESFANRLPASVGWAPFGRIELKAQSGLKTYFNLVDGTRLDAELNSVALE